MKCPKNKIIQFLVALNESSYINILDISNNNLGDEIDSSVA